jgi:hypothetical protein
MILISYRPEHILSRAERFVKNFFHALFMQLPQGKPLPVRKGGGGVKVHAATHACLSGFLGSAILLSGALVAAVSYLVRGGEAYSLFIKARRARAHLD